MLLDIELQDLPLYLIQLGRLALDLHLELAGSLVHQVDGLVGEEPGCDVTVREDCRCNDSLILDPHSMVHLVPVLETTENSDCILDRRLLCVDSLEPPLKGCILLHILPVFIQCCGTDTAELATCKRRLEQVGCIHCPLCCPGSHKGMELINKEDDVAVALGHLLEHSLQPLLELAPELGTSHQGSHIEGKQFLILK